MLSYDDMSALHGSSPCHDMGSGYDRCHRVMTRRHVMGTHHAVAWHRVMRDVIMSRRGRELWDPAPSGSHSRNTVFSEMSNVTAGPKRHTHTFQLFEIFQLCEIVLFRILRYVLSKFE